MCVCVCVCVCLYKNKKQIHFIGFIIYLFLFINHRQMNKLFLFGYSYIASGENLIKYFFQIK